MKTVIPFIFSFFSYFSLFSQSISTTVVISEVYGGAGCGTAGCSTYQNDFIELHNISMVPQTITNASVQYASATGTAWQVTALPASVTLPAGAYYLVAESFGANGITPLPAADLTGTIAMSATAAKVALVTSTAAATALSGACPTSSGTNTIIDLVGYGATPNCNETANAPAPSTTTSISRLLNGCTDTGNNSTDFTTGSPNPQNSSSAVNICSTVLSVRLNKFSLTKTGKNALLIWVLNCTSGRVIFEVQHSLDGVHFSTIYSATEKQERCASPFTFIDKNFISGKNYYRIKTTDSDGRKVYSAVESILLDAESANTLVVYPTLISSQAQWTYNSISSDKVKWLITDLQGRTIHQFITTVNTGENKFSLSSSEFAAGSYLLIGKTTTGNTVVSKFLKQ